MSNLPFTFRVEKDGTEFHAWCPELPGCHTHGKTVNEALENLKDAVRIYLGINCRKELDNQLLY